VTGAKVASIVGLCLTIFGALVLSFRDLRGRRGRPATYGDVYSGFRRKEAWIGFPLIVLGSGLQVLGVVLN
jgi:hypothetical protein